MKNKFVIKSPGQTTEEPVQEVCISFGNFSGEATIFVDGKPAVSLRENGNNKLEVVRWMHISISPLWKFLESDYENRIEDFFGGNNG